MSSFAPVVVVVVVVAAVAGDAVDDADDAAAAGVGADDFGEDANANRGRLRSSTAGPLQSRAATRRTAAAAAVVVAAAVADGRLGGRHH